MNLITLEKQRQQTEDEPLELPQKVNKISKCSSMKLQISLADNTQVLGLYLLNENEQCTETTLRKCERER